MERSFTDIHHGIIGLAAPRTLASRSGNPSERGCPTGRLRAPEAGTLCDHLSWGRAKSQSFPGHRWVVLPGVERLRKWPKTAFHRTTTAIHRESRSPSCRAIMGQLSIGGGFHTFLRRANFIYSRLPSTAESGPSSPSRATLVSQQRVFCCGTLLNSGQSKSSTFSELIVLN